MCDQIIYAQLAAKYTFIRNAQSGKYKRENQLTYVQRFNIVCVSELPSKRALSHSFTAPKKKNKTFFNFVLFTFNNIAFCFKPLIHFELFTYNHFIDQHGLCECIAVNNTKILINKCFSLLLTSLTLHIHVCIFRWPNKKNNFFVDLFALLLY